MFVSFDAIKKTQEDETEKNLAAKRNQDRLKFAVAVYNFRRDVEAFTSFVVLNYSSFEASEMDFDRNAPGNQFAVISTTDVFATTKMLTEAQNHMTGIRKLQFLKPKREDLLGEPIVEEFPPSPSILQNKFFLFRKKFSLLKNMYTVVTREENSLRVTLVAMMPYDAGLTHANNLRFLVGKGPGGEIACVPIHCSDLLYNCTGIRETRALEFF